MANINCKCGKEEKGDLLNLPKDWSTYPLGMCEMLILCPKCKKELQSILDDVKSANDRFDNFTGKAI